MGNGLLTHEIKEVGNFMCIVLDWLSKHQDLVAGWIFGLISSSGGLWLKAHLEKCRFMSALAVELNELRIRTTATVFHLASPLGQLNRETLEFCKKHLEGSSRSPEQDRILKTICDLLSHKDEHLAAANAALPRGERGKAVPHFHITYLQANLSMVSRLGKKRQKALVKVLNYVHMANDKIDDLTFWDRLTFTATNDENHKRAVENSQMSVQAISDACRMVANSAGEAK
jgi:hypothetical protein